MTYGELERSANSTASEKFVAEDETKLHKTQSIFSVYRLYISFIGT